MIPIKFESRETRKQWPRIIENCMFCKSETRYWHEKTNNPVCPICAEHHKVSELKNNFKPQSADFNK